MKNFKTPEYYESSDKPNDRAIYKFFSKNHFQRLTFNKKEGFSFEESRNGDRDYTDIYTIISNNYYVITKKEWDKYIHLAKQILIAKNI